jgi:carboxypeptidase Taq
VWAIRHQLYCLRRREIVPTKTTRDATTTSAITFTTSDERIAALLDTLHELADLGALGALAGWDQETALPLGAAEVRGGQLATLEGILHERAVSQRLGALIQELTDAMAPSADAAADGETDEATVYTDADHGLVRHARRDYERAVKLPTGLVQEIAKTQALSFAAWREARTNNDFATFAPLLGRMVTLQREVADRYGYKESRYDALLDIYEPGLTASRVDTLFKRVREISVAVLQRIQRSGHTVDTSCLNGEFPVDRQVALCEQVLRDMGYDFTRGLVAQSPHPFTSSFGSPFDVRVTIRPDVKFLQAAVMAAAHEGGHALYEQGSDPTLVRTPLAGGASLGAHESQSRLWENAIGRSEPYWQAQFAAVREAFPEQYTKVEPATFARALNAVAPSLIRVEADEVTYNLHVIIRFEMEKAIINGDVAIESLPRLWNEKYQEYLGITPPNDSDGVLQDVHWSHGGFGYFPTYTLGNLYAAQIYAALRGAFPDFDERLASGDRLFALEWLRGRMYRFGAIYEPEELIARVTGEKPNPDYFERYLNEKFTRVYDLPPV